MDVIKLILLCFNKIRNGWRVFIKSICLVGGICPQGTKLRKANFFNLKRGHCSNALQIQIGIDPLRGVEEEEGEEEGGGGWAVDKGQRRCVLHSLISFVKEANIRPILNHITGDQRGR